jgi:RNA polymerase sigma-70 factor (ECF subfamily)
VGEPLAGDLAAEVFTVAFARRRTFRVETVDTRPWLYGIATNLIRNNRRSEQRLLAAVARLRDERVPAVGRIDDNVDPSDRPELAWALASLRRDQRDVLLLHAWAELSHAEIADALEIPLGTVASRLARARRHLRSILADCCGDARPIPAANVPVR